ncbi:MAG TPA: hypothetical protein PKH75_00710 [Bacillota bacterium]|nr:hypothetical protein [Bacillota bacterium]HOB41688.1 hypothetical protein [Bacillota bacterium]
MHRLLERSTDLMRVAFVVVEKMVACKRRTGISIYPGFAPGIISRRGSMLRASMA